MTIKLICSDIDGTLLNKERELSTVTIKEIKRLKSIPFILISSRMPKGMVHLQKQLDIEHLPLIAYNGGLIIDNAKVIHSTEISISVIKNINKFCKSTDLHISLYHNDEWYVPQMDYWAKREQNNTKVAPQINPISKTICTWETENKGAHKIMCMGNEKEIDKLVIFINSNYKNEIIGYRSKPTYLEISKKSISKKTAIEKLLKFKYPKLDLKNILAFGDNYNDIEMLKTVGIGVAVENAKKEVLEVANHKTSSNIDGGVALYLKSII